MNYLNKNFKMPAKAIRSLGCNLVQLFIFSQKRAH